MGTPSEPSALSGDRDELLEELDQTIQFYSEAKRRHPILQATIEKLKELLARIEGESPRQKAYIQNDAVWQLVLDSFDMLVIDLLSLRDRMVKHRGLFDLLKESPTRLRPCDPAEVSVLVGITINDLSAIEDLERVVVEQEDYRRKQIAERINNALSRLVPDGGPCTTGSIETLNRRFRKETESLNNDRNRFRAHRYEHHFDRKALQPFSALQGQLDVFERLLRDLDVAIRRPMTSGREEMETLFFEERMFVASPEGTAEDLSDIMVHGRISEAVSAYGVARKPNKNSEPRYSYYRKRFFAAPPTIKDSEQKD